MFLGLFFLQPGLGWHGTLDVVRKARQLAFSLNFVNFLIFLKFFQPVLYASIKYGMMPIHDQWRKILVGSI